MRIPQRFRPRGVMAVAGLGALAVAAPVLPAGASGHPGAPASVPGPRLKLEIAQRDIQVGSFRGEVFLDPGIWVDSLGATLQFDVRRVPYTSPLSITQVIHTPFGTTVRRPLPASVLDGWNGLSKFLKLKVTNSKGEVVGTEREDFCPNSYNPERIGPGSPASDPYPQYCDGGFDEMPFTRTTVWGLEQGWAVDPAESGSFGGQGFKMKPGQYTVTGTIRPVYRKLFSVSAADATAVVHVTVTKGDGGSPEPVARPAAAPLPRVTKQVPTLTHPPAAALPKMEALPAWEISVSHTRKTHQDYLNFAASVGIAGNSPLDVEGFRSNGSPTMKAYQYYWRDGKVIGRSPAGTMGFSEYNHWHFTQFARYSLLNSAKSLVVTSHKEGFCIAPVDGFDLAAPGATWQPDEIGLSGACGDPAALWVAEQLPVGWDDTYTHGRRDKTQKADPRDQDRSLIVEWSAPLEAPQRAPKDAMT